MNTDKRSEPAPDWMQNPEILEKSTEVPPKPSESEAEPAASDSIPDWMRSSGWQAATTEPKDDSVDVGEVTPDASIAKADIPEWLMSMAPDETNQAAETEPEEPAVALPAGEDGIPDWLKPNAQPDASEEPKMEPRESVGSAFESGGIPMIPDETAADNPMESQGSAEPQMNAETIPDWLKSLNSTESPGEPAMEPRLPLESQPAGMEDTPDWLKSLAPAESVEETKSAPPVPVQPQPASAEDMPDWLKSMAPAEPVEETKIEPQMPVEPQLTNAEDMPDWLKSMTPAEPVEETKIEPQKPVEPQLTNAEDMPDWLKSMAPAAPVEETKIEPPMPVEPQPASTEGMPIWLKSMAPAENVEESKIEPPMPVEPQTANVEDVPDWLKSMASAEAVGDVPAQPTEPMEPQPAKQEEVPDWFKTMTPADAAGDAIPGAGKPVEPQPVIDEDVPDWLKSLAPTQATGPSIVESGPTHSEMPSIKSEPEPTLSAQLHPDLPVPEEPVDQAPVVPSVSENGAVEESFQPTGEVKPLNIGDDALGWLESLAAKQGAKPEELLTKPQDRSAEMPDWLRPSDEKPIEAPEVPLQPQVGGLDQTMPSEPLSHFTGSSESTPGQPIAEALPAHEEPIAPALESGTPSTVQPVSGEEDTMAWLERLSVDQEGASETPSVTPREERILGFDEDQGILEKQASIPIPEESESRSLEPAEGEDISITSWLNRLDAEEPSGKSPTEQPVEQPPAESTENLPDWLRDLENSTKAVAIPKADEDLPDWLRHPLSPVEPEGSSLPEAPVWADENAPVTDQAVPTTPEEWVPAESKLEPGLEPSTIPETTPVKANQPSAEPEASSETRLTPESISTAVPEPVSETVPVSDQRMMRSPTLKQTGMLSSVSVQDKDSELLSHAQSVLDHDLLEDSMKFYMKLIKKGRLLDEVIHDLREATYRYPVDVIIWQTLGDAYMRANRLQDALDAYTKAEELLR